MSSKFVILIDEEIEKEVECEEREREKDEMIGKKIAQATSTN